MQQDKKSVRVVAGLIWRAARDTHAEVLVQQRPANAKSLPLLWEFPGGKVEAGETDEVALARECREEMSVDVHVGPLAWEMDHAYPHMDVTLALYHARLANDAPPQPHAAEEVRWVPCEALPALPFCPADEPLIVALAAGTVRPPQG